LNNLLSSLTNPHHCPILMNHLCLLSENSKYVGDAHHCCLLILLKIKCP
jgi:hypothetical protein